MRKLSQKILPLHSLQGKPVKSVISSSLPNIRVSEELNLYGLNPYEFRLYAHIARRGKCYSNLETIQAICKMSVRKAQYSLKALCELGLIAKEQRKGKTDVYVLLTRDSWKKREDLPKLEPKRPELNTQQTSQAIFVHGLLDLYGLNPYEFRLYAHIAACGGPCDSSLEKITKICKMSIRKAQYSLKTLCDLGLLLKEQRSGQTDVYRLAPRNKWKEPEYSDVLAAERKKVKASLLSLKTLAKNTQSSPSSDEF